ncbi:hypothetical protein DFH27DRAFT_566151, partial [Peziza echinospora]
MSSCDPDTPNLGSTTIHVYIATPIISEAVSLRLKRRYSPKPQEFHPDDIPLVIHCDTHRGMRRGLPLSRLHDAWASSYGQGSVARLHCLQARIRRCRESREALILLPLYEKLRSAVQHRTMLLKSLAGLIISTMIILPFAKHFERANVSCHH